jgi:hypothetical protein
VRDTGDLLPLDDDENGDVSRSVHESGRLSATAA